MDVASTTLAPYLPRLLLEWQRDAPGEAVRERDGTMVFVDISGFTAMSERLATRGRVGAEEVTDVLDSIFTRLLAVAYADSGSLLKFGGDALLLFFDGPGHADRGTHAAAGMRRALRESAAMTTSVGAIRLRMSVGVHSGRFLMALAGRDHRELVVTGPAATRTVELEHAAGAGEILVSPETAALLDPTLLGEPKGPGVLLRRSPPPPRVSSAPSVDPAGLPVPTFVPAALREHLASGGGAGEHRQVTVGFVRFGGTDALAGTAGPETVAAHLDAFMRAVQEAASAYGVTILGTDVDSDGGKVILVAGAPVASDSDEERMVRAARALVDAAPPLPVRVGVNRGHVFVGDVGPAYRRTYTVMGDAVNLAARLMAHAAPGEVVVTRDTLDRLASDVAALPLPPFSVKGKRHPVVAARVQQVRATRRATDSDVRLVGRAEPLAALLAAADTAKAGAFQVVELVGEPGIGKTRLVQELLARASAPAAVVAGCSPYDVTTPYAAMRAVLRRLVGIPDTAEPAEAGTLLREVVSRADERLLPWLPLLAIPVGADVPSTLEAETVAAEFRPDRMRRAVTDLVAATAGDGTVVVLEDTQWIDDASAEMLRHIVGSLGDEVPVLLCVTRRDDAPGARISDSGRVRALALSRLDPAQSKALAVAAAEDLLLPETQLDLIAARADGLPLFLLELVRGVSEQGSLDALPDSVEAVVTARLDALRGPDRTLLRHAAVLGASFPVTLLEQVLGESADDATWRRLSPYLDHRGGQVRFRQSLFHDVAYESLPFRTRRELHARAGEILVAAGDAEAVPLLSLHFHRAQAWDRAWHYSRLAGRRAQDTFANVEAATFLRRAIEASRQLDVPPAEVAAVWESLGDVLHLSGMYTDATDAYASARRLAPATAMPGLLLKEGVVRERLGRYPQALRWFSRALRLAAADNADEGLSRHRVRITLAVAITRHRQGNYRECIRLCKAVVHEAEAIEDQASLAYAYFLLHTACGDLGTDEFTHFQGRALPIFEALGDLIGQSNVLERLGIDAYYAGRWDEAADYYRRSSDLRERAGHVVYAANSAHNVAEIRLDQGYPDEAAEGFRHALRVWRAAGFAHGVVFATCNLGRVAMCLGRYEEAAQLFAQAESTAAEIGAEHALVEVEGRRAELELATGQAEAARDTAASALVRAGRVGGMNEVVTRLQRVLAEAHLVCGDVGLALDTVDVALSTATGERSTYESALALRVRAMLAAHLGEDPTPYEERSRRSLDALGVAASASREPARVPSPV